VKATRDLAEVFCGISDTSSMELFFKEIFTPAEIDDFVLRWRLMEMLYEGCTQREIASRLGVSLCKVTRGSAILRSGNSMTAKLLKTRSETDYADDYTKGGEP
jgi:TrpR family transcriptional regulator, trp operon repressor